MEELIQFLEKYWGVSIVGGVTLGTIITFIYVQIKTLLRDKFKNIQIDRLTDLAKDMVAKANQMEQERNAALKRTEYMEKVQATTFKAISYIVVASKLPTEDKLKLQEDFTKLAKEAKDVKELFVPTQPGADTQKQTFENLKEQAEDVVEVVEDIVTDVIENVATGTENLLSKYVKEK